MIVDLFLVYSFVRRLVTPFEKWDAYKEGIIDKEGNILIPRKKLTKKSQRDAFGIFDQLILNIKKLLAKIPGGSTRLGSYAAALWLIKENEAYTASGILNENTDLDESFFNDAVARFLEEYGDIILESEQKEMTSAGSGAIAGLGVGPQGEPGITKTVQKKYKKKNFKELLKKLDQPTVGLKESTFKVGNLKLNSGENVILSQQDVKVLQSMFKNIDQRNQNKMKKDLMKNKKSFTEILTFAKEAL
jgi:hypothetical protein